MWSTSLSWRRSVQVLQSIWFSTLCACYCSFAIDFLAALVKMKKKILFWADFTLKVWERWNCFFASLPISIRNLVKINQTWSNILIWCRNEYLKILTFKASNCNSEVQSGTKPPVSKPKVRVACWNSLRGRGRNLKRNQDSKGEPILFRSTPITTNTNRIRVYSYRQHRTRAGSSC